MHHFILKRLTSIWSAISQWGPGEPQTEVMTLSLQRDSPTQYDKWPREGPADLAWAATVPSETERQKHTHTLTHGSNTAPRTLPSQLWKCSQVPLWMATELLTGAGKKMALFWRSNDSLVLSGNGTLVKGLWRVGRDQGRSISHHSFSCTSLLFPSLPSGTWSPTQSSQCSHPHFSGFPEPTQTALPEMSQNNKLKTPFSPSLFLSPKLNLTQES